MKLGELSELYYRAAQLNANIRDFWSFIETYDPPATEDGAKTDWKGAIAWLRFRIPQILNHQKEGNIFHFIETTAKIVDEYFEEAVPSGQYVFSPHLISFLLLFPDFPEGDWSSSPEEIRNLGTRFLFWEDDGPCPVFTPLDQLHAKDLKKIKKTHKDFNQAGRSLDLKAIVIDWNFSNEEILDGIKKHLIKRPGFDRGRNKRSRRSSFYHKIKLGHEPSTLLSTLDEILNPENDFHSKIQEEATLCCHDPRHPFTDYEISKKGTAFENAVRKIIKTKYEDGTAQFSNLPKSIDSLMHVVLTGFNLPYRFKTAQQSVLSTHLSNFQDRTDLD